VAIITETKLSRQGFKQLCPLLSGTGYRQRHSRCYISNHAGVTILVKKEYDELGMLTPTDTPTELRGFMKGVLLSLPSCTPLEILGVYMPSSSPGDKFIRSQIYKEIKRLSHRAQDTLHGTHNLIVAGDFNATLCPTDRTNHRTYKIDTQHQDWVTICQLQPLDLPTSSTPRLPTWRKGAAEIPTSRIDDILTTNPALHMEATTQVIDLTGTSTDHNLLMATIPFTSLNLIPPPPPRTTHLHPWKHLTPESSLSLPRTKEPP
jgi:exonuclease III